MPVNTALFERFAAIQKQLIAAYEAGALMSSSSKGRERETFINDFLSRVFPQIYRFGSGDITDALGHRSGQIDVVIEHPFAPSLPSVGSSEIRLYPAESVAAAIEVKSDLAGQWSEVVSTYEKLAPIKREFVTMVTIGKTFKPSVPFVAVGYKGWVQPETIVNKLQATGVPAALVIDPGVFCDAHGTVATGPYALWLMISYLHDVMSRVVSASSDPLAYMK